MRWQLSVIQTDLFRTQSVSSSSTIKTYFHTVTTKRETRKISSSLVWPTRIQECHLTSSSQRSNNLIPPTTKKVLTVALRMLSQLKTQPVMLLSPCTTTICIWAAGHITPRLYSRPLPVSKTLTTSMKPCHSTCFNTNNPNQVTMKSKRTSTKCN